MKALLPAVVVFSMLVYWTGTAAQEEPKSETTETLPSDSTESQQMSAEELRACLLKKTWTDCGLEPISISEGSDIFVSLDNSANGGNNWKLRGPWAKTIADYSIQ